MKKIMRIVLVLIIILFASLSTISFANDFSGLDQVSNPGNIGGFMGVANKVLGVIYMVAIAMSVGMIIVIGIRYIISSPEQKADLKSKAIPYLIGAVLVFGTANIVRFISTAASWIKA